MATQRKDPDRVKQGVDFAALRRDAGYTQLGLAVLAGLTPKTVMRAEQGTHTPSPESIASLAAVLGCEPEALGFPIVTASEYGVRGNRAARASRGWQ